MAKSLKLEQVKSNVDKLTDLLTSRDIHFGDVVDSETTQYHDDVEDIASSLETIASQLRQKEVDYASQEVKGLGSDLASAVSDKERLAQLLALAKSGKLDDVLSANKNDY